MRARVVITGANSAIGRVLVRRTLGTEDLFAVAAVRSERAASQLPAIPPDRGEVARIAYDAAGSLHAACGGARAVIHLGGVLIEGAGSSYEQANVDTTRAVVGAARAAGVDKLVLVSACGADAASPNRFWSSKGRAEALVRESGLAWTVVRCPLVLGCDSAGDRALAGRARSRRPFLLGGGRELEQPIAAADVAEGLLASAREPERAQGRVLDLVGPECLPMREIVARAAGLLERPCSPLAIPVALARAAAALRSRLGARGGITPDVLEVLTGHERRDPAPACAALGLELTPLDIVLAQSLGLEGET